MSKVVPTRLVVCVDGTWFTPDGREDASNGNTSNIFRIWAVVKDGLVTDDKGQQFKQVKKYYHGIGVGGKAPRLLDGIYGTGCREQIKDIYRFCCQCLTGPDDELWLYGFSRGAYVVRAVAGLFHHLRALTFQDQKDFDASYDTAVGKLYAVVKAGTKAHAGELYKHFTSAVREPPRLRFIGVFDTVKALDDKMLHDISFTDSINHFRHAISLNENRPYFNPELVLPQTNLSAPITQRSMVQAWFLGAHGDIGGGARHDGLSLYPLQWMLIESKRYGLGLEFRQVPHRSSLIQNPLEVVFPDNDSSLLAQDDRSHVSSESGDLAGPWHFTYKNGIHVEMQDLRKTHHHATTPVKSRSFMGHFLGSRKSSSKEDFSKKNSPPQVLASSYQIQINRANPLYNNPRKPFKKHQLVGYNECGWFRLPPTGPVLAYKTIAASGTIIHPSVYFVFDVYQRIYSNARVIGFREDIERFRLTALPEEQIFPWKATSPVLESDIKAFRILVCGKTGVGKSTLINRVFGVEDMTQESDLKQGVHDINHAFESEFHPGLLIHDSCGFQAGNNKEVKKVRDFLRARSGKADVAKRIHAIWFCVQTDANRIIERADVELFEAVAQCAIKVPIILVGTKTDKFIDEHETKVRRGMGADPFTDQEAMQKEIDIKTQKLFVERQRDVEDTLAEISQSEWDATSYVAKDDVDSIKDLLSKTLACLDNERVRQFCVAAQIVSVDEKVDTAISETLRLCRHAIRASAAPIPASTLISTPTVSRLICEASLHSFGFPKVQSQEMDKIMRDIVWQNMGKFFYMTLGSMVVFTGIAFGLAIAAGPLGAIALAAGCLMAMPTTARVVISCACDIILILEHAFNLGSRYVGPAEIEAAARDYKPKTQIIHGQVEKLIPLYGISMSLQISKLRVGMLDIINEHRSRQGQKTNSLTELEGTADRDKRLSIGFSRQSTIVPPLSQQTTLQEPP